MTKEEQKRLIRSWDRAVFTYKSWMHSLSLGVNSDGEETIHWGAYRFSVKILKNNCKGIPFSTPISVAHGM